MAGRYDVWMMSRIGMPLAAEHGMMPLSLLSSLYHEHYGVCR
ncbi:hypothetical protein O9929_24670 [Vibrio lentus]|nr:hypothetical protein [Vibrio lentus]